MATQMALVLWLPVLLPITAGSMHREEALTSLSRAARRVVALVATSLVVMVPGVSGHAADGGNAGVGVVDPETITVADVMDVFGGSPSTPASSTDVETPGTKVLMEVWVEAADLHRRHLQSISFADLLERASGAENMYYI